MGAHHTSTWPHGVTYAPQLTVHHGHRHWFYTIPPERLGLRGEYDYHGLQKRARHHLAEQFGEAAIAQLTIVQRGRVVILHGTVASVEQLQQMVQAILTLPGAIHVELRGVEYGAPVAMTHRFPAMAGACA
jgi:hypothetical protein